MAVAETKDVDWFEKEFVRAEVWDKGTATKAGARPRNCSKVVCGRRKDAFAKKGDEAVAFHVTAVKTQDDIRKILCVASIGACPGTMLRTTRLA